MKSSTLIIRQEHPTWNDAGDARDLLSKNATGETGLRLPPHIKEESPLVIGGRVMPSRYFLAPLAGYTRLAFRLAIRSLGGLGLATTDLVQAQMLISRRPKSLALIETVPEDTPLSVQIFSGIRRELVGAAKWLEAHGYQGIDINMGCPMAKVNSSGGGARLMCDTDGACDTVREVVEAVSIPVTVKMRLGWDSEHIAAPALAREFEQLGVAAITLHGRTRAQGFRGDVCLDGIRRTVDAVEQIPIIGNGDVRTVHDAWEMRRITGCHAVAIGRGAMLDPWLFQKLQQYERAETAAEPTPSGALTGRLPGDPAPGEPTHSERIDFLIRHVLLMTEQHGEHACVLFRKFAAWYGATLGIPEDAEDRLRRTESIAEFLQLAEEIRARPGERRSTIATALIRVPNGPVEHW